MFPFKQSHDPGEFFMVQLDHGCELHRLCEDLRGIEVLPKINIENAQRVWACTMQKFKNDGSAGFRSLRQRSEAHGIGALCQRLPLRRPSEKIPGDRLGDFKPRLAGVVTSTTTVPVGYCASV